MKILLIEDDIKIAEFIIKGLKSAGFMLDHEIDGEKGLEMALYETYDTIIVDIMLPKLNGMSLVKKVRENKINTPIIILSARDRIDDRVKGLELGADDYLTKPFAFSELLARIQALIRRAGGIVEPAKLFCEDLFLDIQKREVRRAGQRIELQPMEFSLLEYLLRSKERVVSKTMIMEHVWNYNFDPMTNVVEARICKLRDKIDKGYENKLIHTIRGAGYVLRKKDEI
ncbi:MAG: response regulator transcription factor [Desulfobacteraceae bacterium]|nr:response regulator transcription factor [Desulfobacteraceae bacterium]